MKRVLLSFASILLLAMMSVPAVAAAAPSGGTSRVVPLGMVFHKGRLVEGFALVHGRANAPKPPKPSGGSPLYTFLASGAKWRTTEPYVVNTDNLDGASSSLVSVAVANAAATWEAQTVPNIFGSSSTTSAVLEADWTEPDEVNEVYFGTLDQNTVAVTVVWGVFSGPPNRREILEWDLVFNDALPEQWGDAAGGDNVWDVEDISTHELGHAAGLGDLYTAAAQEQTMYGYASPGETKKRTLASGDVAGIKALYR